MGRIDTGFKIVKNIVKKEAILLKKSKIKTASNPVFSDKMVIQADEVGLDVFHSRPRITNESELEKLFGKGIADFSEPEYRYIKDVAGLGNGTYNTDILDAIIDFKKIGYKFNESIAGTSHMAEFAKINGSINNELKQKIISLLESTENNKIRNEIQTLFFNFSPLNTFNLESKSAILDFLSNIRPMLKNISGFTEETLVELFKTIFNGNQKVGIKRLDKLKKVLEESTSENPLGFYAKFYDGLFSIKMPDKLINKFIDACIVPNKNICLLYSNNPKAVLNAVKELRRMKFDTIDINSENVINEIILNKKSPIMKYIKANKKGYSNITISQATNDPNKYCVILTQNDSEGVRFVFDRKTQRLIYSQESELFGYDRKILTRLSNNDKIEQFYHADDYGDGVFPILKNEVKTTHKGIATHYSPSTIIGQADIYRFNNKTGKITVLSKAFRDPVTGEEIIKHNFQSYSGIKTNYKFSSLPKGDSKFSYTIQDKSGKILMSIQRKVESISENHYVHTINGKRYEVIENDNIIKIIENNQKETLIDLSRFVEENEQSHNIIRTLKQLSPEELLQLNSMKNIKFIPKQTSGARVIFNRNASLENIDCIEIGKDVVNDPFSYLHELGHIRQLQINEQAMGKIKEIYLKECEIYKRKTVFPDNATMDYVVDKYGHDFGTEKFGELKEALSDIYAAIRTPNNDIVTTERTIKFMEHFPETIAEVAKYL